MIDDYAANYVWMHKRARDAYSASVPQALETWVDDYHARVGDRDGLRVPFVPRITDEDLTAISQRYYPEPGYDAGMSLVQKYQRSCADVLIDKGTHAIYVPLPSGAGVVKQSALVDAMRAFLARPAPVVAPPVPKQPEGVPVRFWFGGAEIHELTKRGYQVMGHPPAAPYATSLDYLPTADLWLSKHGADLNVVYRDVPPLDTLRIIVSNSLLGLERGGQS